MEEVQMAIETECAICYQVTQCYNDGEAYICVNREMCKKNERIAILEAELTAAEQRAEDKHRAWQAAERELELARAVVEAARAGFGTEQDIPRGHSFDPVVLTAAIRAYDAARRA